MAIKKYKSKKNNKRNNKNKRTGSKSKKLFAKHSKKIRAHRKTKSRHSKSHNMKGGFSSCGLATVKEPSFSIPKIGSVDGLSIPEGRAAIFRPNCNTSSNQAMVP